MTMGLIKKEIFLKTKRKIKSKCTKITNVYSMTKPYSLIFLLNLTKNNKQRFNNRIMKKAKKYYLMNFQLALVNFKKPSMKILRNKISSFSGLNSSIIKTISVRTIIKTLSRKVFEPKSSLRENSQLWTKRPMLARIISPINSLCSMSELLCKLAKLKSKISM